MKPEYPKINGLLHQFNVWIEVRGPREPAEERARFLVACQELDRHIVRGMYWEGSMAAGAVWLLLFVPDDAQCTTLSQIADRVQAELDEKMRAPRIDFRMAEAFEAAARNEEALRAAEAIGRAGARYIDGVIADAIKADRRKINLPVVEGIGRTKGRIVNWVKFTALLSGAVGEGEFKWSFEKGQTLHIQRGATEDGNVMVSATTGAHGEAAYRWIGADAARVWEQFLRLANAARRQGMHVESDPITIEDADFSFVAKVDEYIETGDYRSGTRFEWHKGDHIEVKIDKADGQPRLQARIAGYDMGSFTWLGAVVAQVLPIFQRAAGFVATKETVTGMCMSEDATIGAAITVDEHGRFRPARAGEVPAGYAMEYLPAGAAIVINSITGAAYLASGKGEPCASR